ncbi:right-handed parallel beta-helix repeat-containing protein [Bacillus salipaludis]|uniref:right-handed parallel beta-helix repeat-containing protein n=1 Tax=Bacillus salipaludis TaxID=2547811 RepID=UPI002E1CB088|nr:right-handed parallel beta-helix repeat-containing protein [Bacillus salipaludis]
MKKLGILIYFLLAFASIHATKAYAAGPEDLTSIQYKEIPVTISEGDDPRDKIQAALNKAKTSTEPIKVIVPSGIYTLRDVLHVYKNTYLKVNENTTFYRSFEGSFLKNGISSLPESGYDGNSNIVIDGGTWVLNQEGAYVKGNGFSIGHGSNILIQNTVIKNVVFSHAVDLAGDKDVLIRNNQFLGYDDNTDTHSRSYAEAVQIDVMMKDAIPGFETYDKTPTVNVRVENNVFGNSDTPGFYPWGVGVGSHTFVVGRAYNNIQITGNIFNSMTVAGVNSYGWTDVVISGNTFNKNQKATWLRTPAIGANTLDSNDVQQNHSVPSRNILIENNQFNSIVDAAIDLYGHKTGYVSDVTVSHNTWDQGNTTRQLIQNPYTDRIFFKGTVYSLTSDVVKKLDEAMGIIYGLRTKRVPSDSVEHPVNAYNLKTGRFRTKSEAVSAQKKLLSIAKTQFIVKSKIVSHNRVYYLISKDIYRRADIDALYKKVKAKTKWNYYIVKSTAKLYDYTVQAGPFLTEGDAKYWYGIINIYGFSTYKLTKKVIN